jgi:hypothetical protein
MNEQTNIGPDSAAPGGKTPNSVRGTAFKVGVVVLAPLLLVVIAAAWFHLPRDPNLPPKTEESETSSGTEEKATLFSNWPKTKPDFVLVLTGQQHGYLQPCGCSDPQKGGLERRYNFVKWLREEKKWDVLAYDVGDVPQIHGPAKLGNVQGLIKYRYAMESMKVIGYTATSFGEYEAEQPLDSAMDEYALNNDEPAVLAANFTDKATLFPDPANAKKAGKDWGKSYVGSWNVTTTPGGIKVGALGIIGTPPGGVAAAIAAKNARWKFSPANIAIPDGLKDMGARKPDFRILLYQGPVKLAKLIPGALPAGSPPLDVILCLSEESDPPLTQDVVGNTHIIHIGHKGKWVGVVGVYKTGKAARPFDLYPQVVAMLPEWKTPPADVATQPVLKLMERYTEELKRDDYLSKHGKIPHQHDVAIAAMAKYAGKKAEYIGSDACKDCHKAAYAKWKGTPHARAYNDLVKAENPSNCQFDPECIVCHTVGYRYQSGFPKVGKKGDLKNVGCESCHGPGSLHASNKRDRGLRELMNPWKAPKDETPAAKTKRLLRIENMCRDCHDEENDVNWKELAAKWKIIDHPTPEYEHEDPD